MKTRTYARLQKNYFVFIYALAFIIFFSFTAQTQTITQLSSATSISINSMKYHNNHLIVAQNGLLIYNVTTNSISLQATIPYPGSQAAWVVGAQGTQAYLASGGNGIFAVYNISNFSSPSLSGQLAIPGTEFLTVGSIATRGNLVYLTGIDTLYMINVSNPASPQLAAQVYIPQSGGKLGIDGNTLYVVASTSLNSYDISSPTNPQLRSSVPHSRFNKGLSVDTVNHRVFLPWLSLNFPQSLGFDAYNMSNPSTPVFLFSDSTDFDSGDYGPSAYSYQNNVLFLSKFGTIAAFDVSSNHGFRTSFNGTVANATVSIDVKSDIFYNAKRGGVEVLRYTPASGGTCNIPTGRATTNVTSSTATFSWAAASGAASYNARYRVVGTSTWTTSNTTTTSFNATSLNANTNYEWQVQTVCSGGNSSFSSSTPFATAAAQACNVPTGRTTTNITSSSATFSWTAASGAANYNARYRVVGTSTWTTSNTTTTSFNATSLNANTNYEWQVQTVCSGGSSSFSSSTPFTTAAAQTCNAPTGRATTNITSSSATFSWAGASGAASYNARYRIVGTSAWTTGNTTNTSFNATSLNANTNYEWQVQTVCSGGSSSFSSSTNFITAGASGCPTPTGLNSGNVSNSSAVLSWIAVSGALSYNLQWKRASSSSWTTVSGLTTNSYSLTGLSSRTDYQFKVQAICSSGSGAYSSPASFRTSGSNRRSDNASSNSIEFKLYPNPAVNNLNFEFTGFSDGSVKLNVYNMLGQEVMSIENPPIQGSGLFSLNISKLSNGIYIFVMENNKLRKYRQFLISR